VKGFSSIFGQDGPIRILTRLIDKGKLPHAFLFTGIEGVGKRMTATAFAMALNCEQRSGEPLQATEGDGVSADPRKTGPWACGTCRSCKKIVSGNHPDMVVVAPAGPMIKIHQIRELISALAFKPFEAKVRVVTIGQSHTMNPAAGNALLKVLEEPPDQTILILTAIQTTDLLPTLVSRCRRIRFNPLSQDQIRFLLENNAHMESGLALAAAAMAGGSYTRALTKSRSDWISRRTWLICGGGFDHPEQQKKMPRRMLLAYAEKLAKNKEIALASLEVILMWLRDLAVWKYAPENIVNQDMKDRIQAALAETDGREIFQMMAFVEQAEKDIRANLNLRLSLDMMMLKLAGIQTG
jgi:DNA polymerase-3 subunit delta'